jgi:hypothetical protein
MKYCVIFFFALAAIGAAFSNPLEQASNVIVVENEASIRDDCFLHRSQHGDNL